MQNRKRNCSSSSNRFLLKIIIFVISCSIAIPTESKKNDDGFSTELIHISSPESPFSINPNLTSHQGLLNHTYKEIASPLILDRSSYLMKLSFGTPKVKYYLIIDTGSDITWIQCLPCHYCYQSEYSAFNPNNSRTFRFEKCSRNETCPYNISYPDNSHSRGDLARETITLGSGLIKTKFENFLFGCGHHNVGIFPYKSGGLAGFNPEERSFITQLRPKHRGKFSYCMAPSGSPKAGKISFGNLAILSAGNEVMTTPLILTSRYEIVLDSITVGNQRLKYFSNSYNNSQPNAPLRLVIDSGANLLYISNSFYSQVEPAVQRSIKAESPVGARDIYRLCYPTSLLDADIPKIKLHFPGVVLELNPINTFVAVLGRFRCLAILPTNGTSILGNLAQTNFLIAYNLVEKKISFKPTNCARL